MDKYQCIEVINLDKTAISDGKVIIKDGHQIKITTSSQQDDKVLIWTIKGELLDKDN